jgi:hypothetical protein
MIGLKKLSCAGLALLTIWPLIPCALGRAYRRDEGSTDRVCVNLVRTTQEFRIEFTFIFDLKKKEIVRSRYLPDAKHRGLELIRGDRLYFGFVRKGEMYVTASYNLKEMTSRLGGKKADEFAHAGLCGIVHPKHFDKYVGKRMATIADLLTADGEQVYFGEKCDRYVDKNVAGSAFLFSVKDGIVRYSELPLAGGDKEITKFVGPPSKEELAIVDAFPDHVTKNAKTILDYTANEIERKKDK